MVECWSSEPVAYICFGLNIFLNAFAYHNNVFGVAVIYSGNISMTEEYISLSDEKKLREVGKGAPTVNTS